MVASVSSIPSSGTLAAAQAAFLSILPRIETHARVYFRHVTCLAKNADRVAEAVALVWKWFARLAAQGRDATLFASVLASFAARAVRSGRRIAGTERAKDVMNELTQRRRGFVVGKLPDFATLSDNPLAEALADNTRSPVPEQVVFRIDFPGWLSTRARRDRRLIRRMAVGERTKNLARRFGLSPARVSQLRSEYRQDWHRYGSEQTQPADGPLPAHA